jgi:hypothetical protein
MSNFSSNLQPIGIIEFQRKPRSDKGKKRGSYKNRVAQAGETAGNVAKYGAALVAGDKVFSTAQSAAGSAGRSARAGAAKVAKRAGFRKVARALTRKANPKSIIGKGKGAAALVGGLVVGDMAVRGVNNALGSAIENRHKLKEPIRKARKRRK